MELTLKLDTCKMEFDPKGEEKFKVNNAYVHTAVYRPLTDKQTFF